MNAHAHHGDPLLFALVLATFGFTAWVLLGSAPRRLDPGMLASGCGVVAIVLAIAALITAVLYL